MRALILGALLGVLWLAFGWPHAVPVPVIAAAVQPVTLAFTAGVLAATAVRGGRWSR